ncbi:MAG TPA: PEP-CTERM sorting domain-containing protein [Rhodanobacter sp.]|nr:PEP-CTERM sorting domain-containing protein [Rhodanobacter sp.]
MSTKLGSKLAILALTAAAATSFAPAADATAVNYDFTVNVTSGPLAGTVQNGSFAYDNSSVVPDSFNSASGLLTAFDFMFNGTTYSASTANTGLLGFDAAGSLTSLFISSSCISLGCTYSPGTDNFTVTPGPDGFLYSTSTIDSFAFGDVSFALAGVHVPEPSTFGLFGFGLLLLGGVAARRRFTLRRFE